jgi:oxaloacetate decarboxylase (Na+ extruding) subunit alpha
MKEDKQIFIVDQTIRDAQQSLWGHMMTSDMILPIAPVMDRVGYRAIYLPGARGGVVHKRYLQENILARYRQIREAIVNTPLRTSFTSWSLSGFEMGPVAITELWIKRVIASGIRSFWFVNYQNMKEREDYLARISKAEGAEIIGALMYTESPVHTDEVWARKIRRLVEMGVDVIQTEDTVGVLTPEATRRLIRIAQKESKGIPFELHTHCTTGLAPVCYVEAMKEGVRIFQTAVSPLANGWSIPSTEQTIYNARRLGLSVSIDAQALKTVSEHFRKIALEKGLMLGVPVEHDIFPFWHHIPGGMRGTMRNQLAEIKQEHRLEEVLEEAGRIRHELGYPVGATPYSQFIGAQALFNVTAGERYKMLSDELIRYALGHYGEPDGPMDSNVKDKILTTPKAKKWLKWREPDVTIKDLRKLEPGLSEDDLVFKLIDPQGEFKDKYRALCGWPK